jgi:hypothetical protein
LKPVWAGLVSRREREREREKYTTSSNKKKIKTKTVKQTKESEFRVSLGERRGPSNGKMFDFHGRKCTHGGHNQDPDIHTVQLDGKRVH